MGLVSSCGNLVGLFAGVETAAVKKFQPSKNELARPVVYQEVTNVIPVNQPPTARKARWE